MSSRSSGGEEQRVWPVSTASGPAPAASGPWGSSGTRVQSAEAAATESAASVGCAWEQQTGSVRSATPTGRELTTIDGRTTDRTDSLMVTMTWCFWLLVCLDIK